MGAWEPSHFITLKIKEKITGINTKIAYPIRLGRIKE